MSLRRDFLVDNLDLPAASGIPDARWEYFQLKLWADDGLFSIDNKSRQIAFSFACAADAIASAILEKRSSVFTSINKEESQEKIRYALDVYNNLKVGSLPKLTRETMSELEFDNGTRISSFPSRAVRGRSRINWYADEFAHVKYDRTIYAGSLPALSKGGGRIRMGSSPMGASGVFWEISEQKLKKFPGYARRATPWWQIYSFCTNVREARKVAPTLLTKERVERFGNERIQALFDNSVVEDFQQEFECLFVDESTAWITWDEIRAAQTEDLHCRQVEAVGTLEPEIMQAIYDLATDVRQGKVEPYFTAGVDVGRTRNTTEIFLVGLSTSGNFPLRLAITLDNISFDDQLSVLLAALHYLPILVMLIDHNGIGRNLAENTESRFPVRAHGIDFTNQSKIAFATDAKMLIQGHLTPIPMDRDLAYQIHSIKKIVTASNNVVFDTATNEKHHADKFWAWALALHAAYQRPATGAADVVVYEEVVEISPY